MIIFAPNRLFPFEVHGLVVNNKRRLVWGLGTLVPLINYLPRKFRDKYVPHANIYTSASLLKLSNDMPVKLINHSYIFPQLERLKKHPNFRKALKGVFLWLEKSPLKVFGEDHLLILQKQ